MFPQRGRWFRQACVGRLCSAPQCSPCRPQAKTQEGLQGLRVMIEEQAASQAVLAQELEVKTAEVSG